MEEEQKRKRKTFAEKTRRRGVVASILSEGRKNTFRNKNLKVMNTNINEVISKPSDIKDVLYEKQRAT